MIIREIIMQALFSKLTAPPLVFNFAADTVTGDVELYNVSDTSELMVGMPVTGDGLPEDAIIASISPAVTVSLPAIADRTASPMTQGFQTYSRRLAAPSAEYDMPALYLIEVSELHQAPQSSNAPHFVDLNCEAWIFTRVGADQDAVPATTLNNLIDGIEAALYPVPQGFRQNLGVSSVLYCRIEGEVQKDPGHNGALAGAIIPLSIRVNLATDTFVIP